jgi:hypothetical protein
MAKILSRCPVCEHSLHVTELTCGNCRTHVGGTFAVCRFCRLAPEHLAFLEMFLRCEGNLSRVEKSLGLSYPTVRNKLSSALMALGFMKSTEEDAPLVESETEPTLDETQRATRREILEAVAHGKLSADEAAIALKSGQWAGNREQDTSLLNDPITQ